MEKENYKQLLIDKIKGILVEYERRNMNHIVSFSGGKDSTAMLLRMIELNYPIDRIVFADTKYEFPGMIEYIKKIEDYINMPIEILRTEQNFEDWFYGKWTRGKKEGQIRGFPKVLEPCYWSRESKFKELNKIGKGNYNYIGIAVDEPKRIREKDGYIYPLVDWGWTEEKCLEYLKEKDLLNPLYEKFSRLGCWWCPKQSIKSLRVLYNDYPKLWEQLKKWDKDSPHSFRPNATLDQVEDIFMLESNQVSIFDIENIG